MTSSQYTTTTTPPLKNGKEIPFTDTESYLTITPNPSGRCQGTTLPNNGCHGSTLPSNGSHSDHVDGRVANGESESESSDDDETGKLVLIIGFLPKIRKMARTEGPVFLVP